MSITQHMLGTFLYHKFVGLSWARDGHRTYFLENV